jgi:hypothetical protein
MQSTIRLCATGLAAAGLLLSPVAYAQGQSPSPPSPAKPGPTPAPADIPDHKLDAAAAAVKKVSALMDTFEKKLAESPATERERVVGEADDAMAKAITDQGLSIEEYTTIIRVAQNDPTVRGKLLQRLQ